MVNENQLLCELDNIRFRTDSGREVVALDRLTSIIDGLAKKEKERILDKLHSEDHKNYIEDLTSDENLYVNLKELTERFIDIDDVYNHEPWDLHQILANFEIMGRSSLDGWYYCDDKLPDYHLTYDIFKRPDRYVSDPVLVVMKSEEAGGTKYIVSTDLMTGFTPETVDWLMSCGYGGSAVYEQKIIAWRPLPVFDPDNVVRYKE